MPEKKIYADIIIDITNEKLDKIFQYTVPKELEGKLAVGTEVLVPFGKGNKETRGYIVGFSETPGYDPAACLKETVETMADGETVVFVAHPGYLDRFILENSSLTTDRTKEVDALISPKLRAWLEAQPDLKLIDYRDL